MRNKTRNRSRKSRKSLGQSRHANKQCRHAGGVHSSFTRRLRIEPLEDRRMLAVITVTSLADNLISDGEVTLREAIVAANTNLPAGDSRPATSPSTRAPSTETGRKGDP